MTPFAVREGNISQDKLKLFDHLVTDMKAMPDLDPSDLVSCHAVCRALEIRHPEARCVDGFFGSIGHDHSWLDLGDKIIADMYPIAGAVPFLVDVSHWIIPWEKLYIERPSLLDEGNRNREHHEGMAARLVKALEDPHTTTNWIDVKALDLAQDIARELGIDDPQWVSRIQLGAIEGIKSCLHTTAPE